MVYLPNHSSNNVIPLSSIHIIGLMSNEKVSWWGQFNQDKDFGLSYSMGEVVVVDRSRDTLERRLYIKFICPVSFGSVALIIWPFGCHVIGHPQHTQHPQNMRTSSTSTYGGILCPFVHRICRDQIVVNSLELNWVWNGRLDMINGLLSVRPSVNGRELISFPGRPFLIGNKFNSMFR